VVSDLDDVAAMALLVSTAEANGAVVIDPETRRQLVAAERTSWLSAVDSPLAMRLRTGSLLNLWWIRG
jgi:hypothetical protein